MHPKTKYFLLGIIVAVVLLPLLTSVSASLEEEVRKMDFERGVEGIKNKFKNWVKEDSADPADVPKGVPLPSERLRDVLQNRKDEDNR